MKSLTSRQHTCVCLHCRSAADATHGCVTGQADNMRTPSPRGSPAVALLTWMMTVARRKSRPAVTTLWHSGRIGHDPSSATAPLVPSPAILLSGSARFMALQHPLCVLGAHYIIAQWVQSREGAGTTGCPRSILVPPLRLCRPSGFHGPHFILYSTHAPQQPLMGSAPTRPCRSYNGWNTVTKLASSPPPHPPPVFQPSCSLT